MSQIESLQSSAAVEPVGPSIFSAVLRRRKRIVLGLAALVVVATVAFTARQTKIYASTASVVVQGPPGQAPAAGPNMATEVQVAGSLAVAQVVVDQEHLDMTARELRADLSTHVPVDSQVLQFTYSSTQPKLAQERAEAFADAYLAFRHTQLEDQSLASAASLQRRIETLTKRLSDLQATFPSLSEQRLAVARAQANAQATQIGLLEQKLGDINTASNFAGTRLGPAPYPKSPARPRMLVNIVAALFAGLLLGFGVGAAREYADGRIRSREDLGSRLGAPVLSSIPTRRRVRAAAAAGGLITLREPDSVEAEAFRGLRANLLFATSHIGARSVLITSADVDQGNTWVAANLAVALAAGGKRVVLVSADLRRPCLQMAFGTEPNATLFDVLMRSVDLHDAVHGTPVAGLAFVEGRSKSSHSLSSSELAVAADLADTATARRLVRELASDTADIVLVCAPPLMARADTIAWAPACDGVLLVSDVRTTTRADSAKAREQLERAQATVIGAVLLERGRRRWRRLPRLRSRHGAVTDTKVVTSVSEGSVRPTLTR
jgi:succinoglycan biosynthesis transport protein ExoP